jgi:hypothetical protein
MRSRKGILLFAVATCAVSLAITFAASSAGEPKDDAAVARARREVKLLDDVYKAAVVLITEHYVNGPTDLAAGEAAVALFAAMKEKGWHEAALVDATGEPINPENSPRDEFERKAIEKISGGAAYYDEVVEHDGKRTLRAATIVPVVMEKCVMCHKGYKVGDTLGAISYKLAIQ